MFIERDRRFDAVQFMLSTGPSKDNRIIVSIVKMPIHTVRRLRVQLNGVLGHGYNLWCNLKWGPCYTSSHFQSRLESQLQTICGCVEECGDSLLPPADRGQIVGVAAGRKVCTQVQRGPDLTPEEVLRLFTFVSFSFPLPPVDLLCLCRISKQWKNMLLS